jgi:hypothetical protein
VVGAVLLVVVVLAVFGVVADGTGGVRHQAFWAEA